MGEKLLQGVSCAALGIRMAATASMNKHNTIKRGLNFCIDIKIIFFKLKFETEACIDIKAKCIVAVDLGVFTIG